MVREYDNQTWQINPKNIRNWLDSLMLPELEKYQIGLGSASTRTAAQKRRAIAYTNQIIAKIPCNAFIIFTDESVLNNAEKHGGCGGSLTINGKEVDHFSKAIETNDAQVAELEGINEALAHIETLEES